MTCIGILKDNCLITFVYPLLKNVLILWLYHVGTIKKSFLTLIFSGLSSPDHNRRVYLIVTILLL